MCGSRRAVKISAVLSGVLAMGLAMLGCERLERAPESNIRLQAVGRLVVKGTDPQTGVLTVRDSRYELAYEIKDSKTQAVIAGGKLPANALSTALKSSELSSQVEGSRLTVEREVEGQVSIRTMSFSIRETRWMTFESGTVVRGSRGQVTIAIKTSQGDLVLKFVGQTMTQPRVDSVLTTVPAGVTSKKIAGGGFNSVVKLDLRNGAGVIESGPFGYGWMQSFVFEQSESNGMQVAAERASYVEVTDQFSSRVRARRLPVAIGLNAEATGVVQYQARVSVTAGKVLVMGSSRVSADLTSSGGDTGRIEGEQPEITTEFEW